MADSYFRADISAGVEVRYAQEDTGANAGKPVATSGVLGCASGSWNINETIAADTETAVDNMCTILAAATNEVAQAKPGELTIDISGQLDYVSNDATHTLAREDAAAKKYGFLIFNFKNDDGTITETREYYGFWTNVNSLSWTVGKTGGVMTTPLGFKATRVKPAGGW